MYRFFNQPQLNTYNNSLTSEELLVFKQQNDTWCQCPTVDQPVLLDLVTSIDPDWQSKLPALAINCTKSQFCDPLISDALINLQHQVFPRNLRIELTPGKSPAHQINLLVAQAENYRQHGIQISIDQINQVTNLDSFSPLLEQTREIKFRLSGNRTDCQLLKFWQVTTHRNHQRFVVFNVNSKADVNLLDDFDVFLRQGPYYGISHQVESLAL